MGHEGPTLGDRLRPSRRRPRVPCAYHDSGFHPFWNECHTVGESSSEAFLEHLPFLMVATNVVAAASCYTLSVVSCLSASYLSAAIDGKGSNSKGVRQISSPTECELSSPLLPQST